ncbi:MBL fold metallo-hydrolase RNA specificity domain-containing protein [Fundidesulfovibrio agrisoli]|uniref:MBL fold metallo-hydrolase RNA specificity domain-containing protein n=1 Tax=Fundidesulfovibrio agrisoli TaxID=2922717 RepID=UPI001FADBF98|nr:MBL fold metallo-hydrolase [Fundidesulfovibrio agrisoli]
MKIKFLGAAKTVTGSCYMMETGGTRFAVDCGLHQGNREIEARNLDYTVYQPHKVDFFLITHAHMDHSGLLPRMVKNGFAGKVYLTPPTKDLLWIMLQDSAHIQEMEAEQQNRKNARHGGKPAEPLYTQSDATAVMPLMRTVEYNEPFEPAPGVKVVYRDAGHILGSAFIEVWITENGTTNKLVFSGDLGKPDQLIIKDPTFAETANYLFLESTYGDRDHKDPDTSLEELGQAISYSYAHGEKVIIPAFAVERTQEVLYSLHMLSKSGKLPKDMPVFVDSPLAIRATEIFRQHPEYMETDIGKGMQNGEDPFSLPNLRFTLTADESRSINSMDGPAIVISASGMCNAGRIKHHLRHNIWRKGASIVFVGYQGQGTPGRKIVDGAKTIKIMGEDLQVAAKVWTIGGFSAHAGQSQILQWLGHFKKNGMEVFLVHGESDAMSTLAGLIESRFGFTVHMPEYLEECTLKPGIETAVTLDTERAMPKVDWGFLLADTEAKFVLLRQRLDRTAQKPWVDQVELRDKLLEVNKDLMELISEM